MIKKTKEFIRQLFMSKQERAVLAWRAYREEVRKVTEQREKWIRYYTDPDEANDGCAQIGAVFFQWATEQKKEELLAELREEAAKQYPMPPEPNWK